jgi:hypothetical protein
MLSIAAKRKSPDLIFVGEGSNVVARRASFEIIEKLEGITSATQNATGIRERIAPNRAHRINRRLPTTFFRSPHRGTKGSNPVPPSSQSVSAVNRRPLPD